MIILQQSPLTGLVTIMTANQQTAFNTVTAAMTQ